MAGGAHRRVGGNCGASPPSTIQLLIWSKPQEAATMRRPPQQLKLHSPDKVALCQQLNVQVQLPTVYPYDRCQSRKTSSNSINKGGQIKGCTVPAAGERFSHLASNYSDRTAASSSFLCRVKAPSRACLALQRSNNQYADGAPLESCRVHKAAWSLSISSEQHRHMAAKVQCVPRVS